MTPSTSSFPMPPLLRLTPYFPIPDQSEPAWSPPEKALTPAKIVGMISVLITVAFEVAIPTTAAVGA